MPPRFRTFACVLSLVGLAIAAQADDVLIRKSPGPAAGPARPPLVRQRLPRVRADDPPPAGTVKTQSMGGRGGSPFVKIDDARRPVIGFHITVSEWGGNPTLREVEPLYDSPAAKRIQRGDGTHPGDEVTVLAKPGYAVGGLLLSGPDYARAVQVLFLKTTPTGLDPKQAYVSPWYGGVIGEDRLLVGGTGKRVAGVFGRKGLNTDQLGLLMDDALPTTRPTSLTKP